MTNPFIKRNTSFRIPSTLKNFTEKRKAIWSAIEKPIYDLNRTILKWKKIKNFSIIIFGTFDHTNFLFKKFPELKKFNIKYFIPYRHYNDNIKDKKKINKFNLEIKKINKLKNYKNTIYLISSYEFTYDIEYELKKNKVKFYHKLYSGYSRDIKNCFKIMSIKK